MGQQVIEHCRKLSTFSDEPGAITRTFLSPAMRGCLDYFLAWALRIGMSNVRIDSAGNFRALLIGSGSKKLVIGSHLDSVPHAGAFDGVLGVVMGMAIAESFHGRTPPCSIEVVGFSEEEGVRFRKPFIGSTAFVNGLDDGFLQLRDRDGICLEQAITAFGLDASAVTKPQMTGADAYLEFHIEQGPVLETLGLPLGIVHAIAGQTRATMVFTGHANHAGTTPMNLRQDAFTAAAEWALQVERTARNEPGLVGTVGSVQLTPDAPNVVPGSAQLSLDLRHAQDEVRLHAFESLLELGRQIAADRKIAFKSTLLLDQSAVPLKSDLITQVVAAHAPVLRIASGAGHDAMILAKRVPSAMLFLRSPGGISHHPDENVLPDDVDLAFKVGRAFVESFS